MPTRRDALIAAAAELLDRGGPAGVTLREVGRAAGVSHNAPYNHFASKDELLAAIAERELRRLSDEAEAAGPLSARTLLMAYVEWALGHPARFKLTYGPWAKAAYPELKETAGRYRRLFIAAVETAQAAKQLPPGDPERVSSLLLACAHGATDLALAGHLSATGKGRADPADLVADLFGYLDAR